MKVYIAGKITGFDGYKEKFAAAEELLTGAGHTAVNPTCLPLGFSHSEYLHINLAMIDACDMVYLLDNWSDSQGARLEHFYADSMGKKIQRQEHSYE